MRFLPYGTQSIGADDIRAVARVLRSGFLTQGPEVRRFEEAFAKKVGASYAVSVSSGTAGLHLACLAAGVEKGDRMIVSPNTFVASANAVLYACGTPEFADIDPRTLGMDCRKAVSQANAKTKGFVQVHFAGQPAAVDFKMATGKKMIIIEDACHALGAKTDHGGWRSVGSCARSDMAVFSFHPVKHIATGEGGMVTTRKKDLYEKLLRLRTHGIEKNPSKFLSTGQKGQPWYYEMQELGFNYRMTDIQCALGLSQLKKLDDFVARRQQIAAQYDRFFSGVDWLQVPERIKGTQPSYHLYVLRIQFKAIRMDRSRVMGFLREKGIGTQVHYIPVPLQPYYSKRFGYQHGTLPETEKYYEEALSIPMYPALNNSDVRRVADAVKDLGRRCAS